MAAGKPASKGSRSEAQERLLVEAAQKDPRRFAELYEDNFERVYAFIARRVRDRDVAEDLTSDVFHKALANLAGFDWRGIPFAAWLIRIAANLVADRWKRAGREVAGDPPELSTEINLEEVEQRGRVFRAVEDLPTDQRRVIGMRFAEGKSIREIARELAKTEGAIKQLQFRGLEKLRAQLGEQNG
jgi:RNA polymerase sigma-70 factor (ECF subfamily)